MKKLILSLSLVVIATSSHAQVLGTNSFISTLTGWLTDNPPSIIFSTNDVLELSSGVLNNNSQNLQLYVDARVNPLGNFATGCRMYNNSVLGSVSAIGGYVGYGIINNSIRITPEAEFGYDIGNHAGYVAPTLMAEKAMTSNTYTQIGINMHIVFHGQQNYTPGVFVGAGFTF